MLKHCSRCKGLVMRDGACINCGADYLPIQAWEVIRERNKDQPDLYHNLDIKGIWPLVKGIERVTKPRLPRKSNS